MDPKFQPNLPRLKGGGGAWAKPFASEDGNQLEMSMFTIQSISHILEDL